MCELELDDDEITSLRMAITRIRLIARRKRESMNPFYEAILLVPISSIFVEIFRAGWSRRLIYINFFIYELLQRPRCILEELSMVILTSHLRSEWLMFKAVQTVVRNFHRFPVTQKRVFGAHNEFLHKISRKKATKVDFTTYFEGTFYRKVSKNGSLIWIVETSDYKFINSVSSFFGMVADQCCEDCVGGHMTEFLTIYVKTVRNIYQQDGEVCWIDEKVLQQMWGTNLLKSRRAFVFAVFQSPEIGTLKWSALDYVWDHLKKLGDIQFMVLSVWKCSHTLCNLVFKTRSKRTSTSMKASIAWKRLLHELNAFSKSLDKSMETTTTNKEKSVKVSPKGPVHKDTPWLVRDAPIIITSDLRRFSVIFGKLAIWQ